MEESIQISAEKKAGNLKESFLPLVVRGWKKSIARIHV